MEKTIDTPRTLSAEDIPETGTWIQVVEGQVVGVHDYHGTGPGDWIKISSEENINPGDYYDIETGQVTPAEPEIPLDELLSSYISQNYPQKKQNSDLADKLYFENVLKASGRYPDIEKKIVHAVAAFYAAKDTDTPKTPAELAADMAVADDSLSGEEKDQQLQQDVIGLEQLIKVGIRVKWVQDCKRVYKQTAAQVEAGDLAAQMDLPPYPL